MSRIPACLALLVLPFVALGSPPTTADFNRMVSNPVCEQPKLGRLVFVGNTMMLDDCLDRAPADIEELRITSLGGLADVTLKTVEKYRGRIDHVIVEGVCAGTCASFVVPAAKRLSVGKRSYVLLVRGSNARQIDEERERLFADLHKLQPDASDEQINGIIEWSRQKALADEPAQKDFAARTLACNEWLDPTAPPERAMPLTAVFLLVTPEMAARCLKGTKIQSFWKPEAEDAFAKDLKIFRARR